jgi:crossover junction endodeoxyribonuclease RusA
VNPIVLVLPFPPTVNHYYRPGYRDRAVRQLTDEAKQFRKDVHIAAMMQLKLPLPKLSGRLAVRAFLAAPDHRRYDLDNRMKGLLDAIQHSGIYADDQQIDQLTIERFAPCSRGYAKVEIEEII